MQEKMEKEERFKEIKRDSTILYQENQNISSSAEDDCSDEDFRELTTEDVENSPEAKAQSIVNAWRMESSVERSHGTVVTS